VLNSHIVPKEKTPEFLIRVWFEDGQERYQANAQVRAYRGFEFTKIRGNAARYASVDAARYAGYVLKDANRRIVDFEVEEP
jgi:hypothetical protein